MKRTVMVLTICLLVLTPLISIAGHGAKSGIPTFDPQAGPIINLTGVISDSHGEPINEATINIVVDNHEVCNTTTAHNGIYCARFQLDEIGLKTGRFDIIDMNVQKSSFKSQAFQIKLAPASEEQDHISMVKDIMMPRVLGPAFWISTIVFLVVYLLISFELLHRTVAAMLGAALMLTLSYTVGTLNLDYRIITFEHAVASIDMNVIFLLMGMMIIVGILKNTGVFQWCAYVSYKIARGKVFLLVI